MVKVDVFGRTSVDLFALLGALRRTSPMSYMLDVATAFMRGSTFAAKPPLP